MDPKFPLEVADIILGCLDSHNDKNTLRNCALVSRGWARSSQRSLFRDMRLPLYKHTLRLRTCLESSPHLATYTRAVTFGQNFEFRLLEYLAFDTYMTSLDVLLSLFTHVTSVEVKLHRSPWSDASLEQFLSRLHVFICTSPVVELTLRTSMMDIVFPALNGLVIGSHVRRLSVLEWEAHQPPPSTIVARLPSLEVIRLGCYQHKEICGWLRHQQERLPNLTSLEILVAKPFDLREWCGPVLRDMYKSLRLETFRFEFVSDFYDSYPDAWDHYPLNLEGLHFQHVLFTIHVPPHPLRALTEGRVLNLVEWWTKSLNSLPDSKTSACFTELTFTVHFLTLREIMEAWHALDVVLCHEAFRGLRGVHFVDLKGCRITERAYPTDAAHIQLALPRLAGRGLLSL